MKPKLPGRGHGVGEVKRGETKPTIRTRTQSGGLRSAWQNFTHPAICIALVLLCAFVFGRIAGHGFVNYDDDRFVVNNAQVQSGLTCETATWAFSNQV